MAARVRASEVLRGIQSEEYAAEVKSLNALTEIYRGYKKRLKALLAVAEWGAKPELQEALLDSIAERPTAATEPTEEEPKP